MIIFDDEIDTSHFFNSEDYKQMQLALGYKPKMERHLDSKLGFDLGWDYYAFSLKVPANLKGCKDVLTGHAAAAEKKITRKPHDEYIRKWLLLRANAWKRNRIFDEGVTPSFLKKITNDICPVTRESLTNSTGLPTDWSIDRVNNDLSYCPGNLVMVSARANILKNNYTYEEIFAFAYDNSVELPKNNFKMEPLTRFEWARWALICSLSPNGVDEEGNILQHEMIAPCVTVPPRGMIESIPAFLQVAISGMISQQPALYKDVVGLMHKSFRVKMNALVNDAKKKYINTRVRPMDVWYNKRLFKDVLSAYESLTEAERTFMLAAIKKYAWAMDVSSDVNMGHESKGYTANATIPFTLTQAQIDSI